MVYYTGTDVLVPDDELLSTGDHDRVFEDDLSSEADVDIAVTPSKSSCPCNGPETLSMIECDKCKKWYHLSCVATMPADPSNISDYCCPVCYKVDIGQTVWHGEAGLTEQRNRRVQGAFLRQNPTEMADTSTIQQHKNAHPASVTAERRYGRKRELHVIRLPNGGLTDMHGTPIVVNPPHNAPLPVPVVNPAHRRGETIRQESTDSLETNRRSISAAARRTPRPMMARSSGHAKSKSSAFPLHSDSPAPKPQGVQPSGSQPLRQSFKIKLAPLKTATSSSSDARNRQGEHNSVEGNPLLRGSRGRFISTKNHSTTTQNRLIIKLKLR